MIIDQLTAIILANAGTRQNGKIASERTFTARKESILASFRLLNKMGYKLKDPRNLSEKHVEALMKHWAYEKKATAKTMEGNLSSLRIYCDWIGKSGMVKDKYHYLPEADYHLLRVNSAAKSSKSWAGNSVGVQEQIARADAVDERLGVILRVQVAFGLRREEALKCKPHVQDFIDFLQVKKGQGKGGKPRSVVALTSAQFEAIEYAKQKVTRHESLGWPFNKSGKLATLEQNVHRYHNLMRALGLTKKDLGITGHGLRAQFAENNALSHGLIPPSMGGVKAQMSKQQRKSLVQILSEAMGHHREVVMSAYYCSFGKGTDEEAAEIALKNIENGVDRLAKMHMPDVEHDRWQDCTYIRQNLEVLGVDITLKQVQFLWKIYSLRNNTEWVRPEHSIAVCVQSSALAVCSTGG